MVVSFYLGEEDGKPQAGVGDQTDIEYKNGSTSRAVELQVEGGPKMDNSVDIGRKVTFTIPQLEKHYCSVCTVDQPVRSKHCSACMACVPSFDHHCVWVGNCVGEKNKPLFFIFLNYQCILLFILPLRTALLLRQVPLPLKELLVQEWAVTGLAVIYFFLCLSVGSLLRYHYVFAFRNITTWEFLRWDDISYLRGFDEQGGSPFSVSYLDNLEAYFRPPCRTFYDWVPVKTPRIN